MMVDSVLSRTPLCIRRLQWRGHKHFGWRLYRRMLDSVKGVSVYGIELELPVSREGIVEELIVFGVHEPFGTQVYMQLLDPNDVVLDIGTNIGYFCAVASKRLGKGGAIYGIEPDPDVYKCAVKNIAKLPIRAEVRCCAIAQATGKRTFYRSATPNWGSLCESADLSQIGSISVDALSIDDYCRKHGIYPTVIRMDIEGGELEAIKGGVHTLASARPKLCMEVHPWLLGRERTKELLSTIGAAGYTSIVRVDRGNDYPWCNKKVSCEMTTCDDLVSLVDSGRLDGAFSIVSGGMQKAIISRNVVEAV